MVLEFVLGMFSFCVSLMMLFWRWELLRNVRFWMVKDLNVKFMLLEEIKIGLVIEIKKKRVRSFFEEVIRGREIVWWENGFELI